MPHARLGLRKRVTLLYCGGFDYLEESRRGGKPCEAMIVGIPYHTIKFERVETVERTAVQAS